MFRGKGSQRRERVRAVQEHLIGTVQKIRREVVIHRNVTQIKLEANLKKTALGYSSSLEGGCSCSKKYNICFIEV
jgi:hypothetical protein